MEKRKETTMTFYENLVMQTQQNYSMYYQTYQRGGSPYKMSTEEKPEWKEQIRLFAEAVKWADCILVGGASGLSAAGADEGPARHRWPQVLLHRHLQRRHASRAFRLPGGPGLRNRGHLPERLWRRRRQDGATSCVRQTIFRQETRYLRVGHRHEEYAHQAAADAACRPAANIKVHHPQP